MLIFNPNSTKHTNSTQFNSINQKLVPKPQVLLFVEINQTQYASLYMIRYHVIIANLQPNDKTKELDLILTFINHTKDADFSFLYRQLNRKLHLSCEI